MKLMIRMSAKEWIALMGKQDGQNEEDRSGLKGTFREGRELVKELMDAIEKTDQKESR